MAQRTRKSRGSPTTIVNFPLSLSMRMEDFVDSVRYEEGSEIRSLENLINRAIIWGMQNNLENFAPPPELDPKDAMKLCTRIERGSKASFRRKIRALERTGLKLTLSQATISTVEGYITLLESKKA